MTSYLYGLQTPSQQICLEKGENSVDQAIEGKSYKTVENKSFFAVEPSELSSEKINIID